MATIAIGDIHGNLPALSDFLDQLRPESPGRYGITLGDYIDRGPDSKGCIDAILAFAGQCRRRSSASAATTRTGCCKRWVTTPVIPGSWALQPLDTIQSYSPEAARAVRKAARGAGLRLHTGSVPAPCITCSSRRCRQRIAVLRRTAFVLPVGGVHPRPGRCPPGVCGHRPARASAQQPGLGCPRLSRRARWRGHGRLLGHHNNADIDANGWPHPRVLGATVVIEYHHRAWCADRHAFSGPPRLPERQYSASWTETEGTDHD